MISGRASLISRFIFRMTPICSSLFSSENFSSLLPVLPPREERKTSRVALDSTTISLCVTLSVSAMGTCCSATRHGSSGGGSDCVPVDNAASVKSHKSIHHFVARCSSRINSPSHLLLVRASLWDGQSLQLTRPFSFSAIRTHDKIHRVRRRR